MGNLGTIPKNYQIPKIDILIIPITQTESVIFIEVERRDVGSVYYSSISQIIYVRRNDRSIPLKIQESLDLIASKSFPKVFVTLGNLKISKDEIILRFIYSNEGVEPSGSVNTLIHLFYLPVPLGIEISVETEGSYEINLPDCECIKEYQIDTKKTKNDSFFPLFPIRVGNLRIRNSPETFELRATMRTYDKKGYTYQEILIKKESENVTIEDIKKEFRPYITF